MRRLISVIFFVLSTFEPAMAGDGNIVTLQEKASISEEYIVLGDIAEVIGPDAKDLALIILQRAPKGNRGITISSDHVARKIREKHPEWMVAMKGSPMAFVSSNVVKIPGKDIEALFQEAVKKDSPWKDGCEMSITDIKAPESLSLPEKDRLGIQAKFSQGEDFLGLVTATISSGNESRVLCRISGRIVVKAQIPVTKKAIRRGAVITEDDIEIKSFDISSSPLAVISESECLGKRAKTMLQAGRPVLRSNIEQPPIIKKGDIVSIQARSESFLVQDRGIALKDGHLNESIPVRNAGSGKQITGTIIAHSLVEVPF